MVARRSTVPLAALLVLRLTATVVLALDDDDDKQQQLHWEEKRDRLTPVPVIETPGHYEYEPTALRRGGTVDVWTCSGAIPPHNFDAIMHTQLTMQPNGSLPRQQSPVPALLPTHNGSHIDGWGLCAPSVVSFPHVVGTEELRMYCEWQPARDTAACLALQLSDV